MGSVDLALFGMALIASLGALWWRWHRGQHLRVTHESVRCPLHDCQAHVTVRTGVGAQSHRRYVDVAACSLLADVATALPEHTAYLADFPPYKVRLETARSYPVHTAKVTCPQSCLFVLDAAAASVTPQRVLCTSGAGDGIYLVGRVSNPRMARVLWYHSV